MKCNNGHIIIQKYCCVCIAHTNIVIFLNIGSVEPEYKCSYISARIIIIIILIIKFYSKRF